MPPMTIQEIIESIDEDLALLRRAREVLAGAPEKPIVPESTKRKKKRNLSPEGRKRIAEAVRRRWAAQKKSK